MVDNSFLMGGGVNILWYNILTPPPSKKYSRTVFCKWNPVTTKLQDTIHLHITDNTIPWLTILFNGRGGVNILWYNILTPPPPKNIQEQYFANGIQLQLSFKTQNIHISQTILFHGCHFFLMGCGGGGLYIMV